MPAVSRELSITYGSITVGGGTERLLDFPLQIQEGPDQGTLTFSFVSGGDTEAAFDAEIATVETAFRTPRADLTVTQGAETLYSWVTSANTGYNHDPRLNKDGDETTDSGRRRRYQVTIVFDLPSERYLQDGRRDSTVTLDFTPARRRTLTIDAEYRSIPGGPASARAQYEANIGAYASALITGFGGTWELADETQASNDTDTICTITRVYDEIIYDQKVGTLNDPEVVRQELTATVTRVAPGDSGATVSRFAELDINYSVWIDKTLETDLEKKWTNTLRKWVIAAMLDRFNAATGALVNENVSYDGPENRIMSSMTMWVITGNNLIEWRHTKELMTDFGKIIVPAWTGDPFSKYLYQGPMRHTRRTTDVERRKGMYRAKSRSGSGASNAGAGGGLIRDLGAAGQVTFNGASNPFAISTGWTGNVRGIYIAGGGGGGGKPQGDGGSGSEDAPSGASGGEWFELMRTVTSTPLVLGRDGYTVPVTDITTVVLSEWFKALGPIGPATGGRTRSNVPARKKGP